MKAVMPDGDVVRVLWLYSTVALKAFKDQGLVLSPSILNSGADWDTVVHSQLP